MNKIVIIDDHQLFLHGLKLTLENENNEVSIFNSPIQALAEMEKLQPDLILMDLYMPEMNGVQMIESLVKAELAFPVVVLSACEAYQDVYHALKIGAMGFIPKSYAPQMMLDALQKVLEGELFVPHDVAQEVDKIAKLEEKNKQAFHLSDRQIQILKLLHDGKTNREIADLLFISQDTVKFHQKGLYTALDVSGSSSRLKAVEKALSLGLIN